jgi:hypothetical protein
MSKCTAGIEADASVQLLQKPYDRRTNTARIAVLLLAPAGTRATCFHPRARAAAAVLLAAVAGWAAWTPRHTCRCGFTQLCIEVCCCFYRAFRIRLNQFLYNFFHTKLIKVLVQPISIAYLVVDVEGMRSAAARDTTRCRACGFWLTNADSQLRLF